MMQHMSFVNYSVAKESEERKVLVSKMLDVILAEYASELATEHVIGGASIQYNTMVKNSYRLKDSIPIFTKVLFPHC